ncbi:hypothetical protein [Acinetobacter sp.]|uniref:hypothetical protein n=1 Tax=Acinetobacter sp. TaxID=472 RepID=UPI0031D046AF
MPRWTEESRQLQRERILKNRPFDKSTGARTAEGKATVSKNALKPFEKRLQDSKNVSND